MSHAGWRRGLKPESFMLLAPSSQVSQQYCSVVTDDSQYDCWLRRVQILRGEMYLKDDAISQKHLTDGQFVSRWDSRSWHIIAREGETVCATMRITLHQELVRTEELAIAQSGLLGGPHGDRARQAILNFQESCRTAGEVFAEVGGWAADSSRRGNRRNAALLLSCWPVTRSVGRVNVLSIVTSRNHSIDILNRMGARPLSDLHGALPPYYDPLYRCEIHLANLANWRLHSDFEEAAQELQELLYDAPVFVRAGNALEPNDLTLR